MGYGSSLMEKCSRRFILERFLSTDMKKNAIGIIGPKYRITAIHSGGSWQEPPEPQTAKLFGILILALVNFIEIYFH